MQDKIQTPVSAQKVWQSWERIHAQGSQGKSGKFRYEIFNLVAPKRFSMLWKSFFVKIIFHYEVSPLPNKGAEVLYDVEIKGLFGWLARRFLQEKMKEKFRSVLVAALERL